MPRRVSIARMNVMDALPTPTFDAQQHGPLLWPELGWPWDARALATARLFDGWEAPGWRRCWACPRGGWRRCWPHTGA
ncbi:hypothetical protein ACFP81_02530 [Deinococcus lacus]|uniref:Uncharacterized protein n=1 Tax=Deinococcus lacus TaxID=392561 RepID=A0ABW1YA45_9DEIO